MRDEPAPPRASPAYTRVFAAAVVGVATCLAVSIAVAFAGFDWLEAGGLGAAFGLPVFFSAMRWQAVADFCLGLLEAAGMVLGVLAAALAAVLGAIAS